jgi:di/tricarboxylate transporter
MSVDLLLTLCVLTGAVILFVSEKLPVDVVAILVLSSLLLFGVVTPGEALSGFSSPATITVAAMFVLSAGLQRSGVLRGLGEWLRRVESPGLMTLVMMAIVAFSSAFINNTAIVAIFLPLVLAAAVAQGRAPSKFLMPLSFASQFGGVCTLVGTSTNLLVDALARKSGQPGFDLFEFAPLGLWFVGAGTLYMLAAQRFLLPDLGIPDRAGDEHRGRYLAELHVEAGSPTIGRTGSTALPVDTVDTFLLEIFRDGRALEQPRTGIVAEGDIVLVRGDWNEIQRLRRTLRLRHDPVAPDLSGDPDSVARARRGDDRAGVGVGR